MENDLTDLIGDLYEEYREWILRRDQVRKEAGSIWTAYLKEFGPLVAKRFSLQIECIRLKKQIAYIMQAVNAGKTLNLNDMDIAVAREMLPYRKQLQQLMEDGMKSLKSKVSTDYTVRRVRQIYRQIAKLIHPDMHPDTETNEKLKNLWQRTEDAYGENDLKGLEELLVLVQKALKGEQVPVVTMTPDALREKIDQLKEEVHTIRTSDPYQYADLLSDKKAVQAKTKELKADIKDFEQYLEDLKEDKRNLLADSGISIELCV